jgi:hypothetical protein
MRVFFILYCDGKKEGNHILHEERMLLLVNGRTLKTCNGNNNDRAPSTVVPALVMFAIFCSQVELNEIAVRQEIVEVRLEPSMLLYVNNSSSNKRNKQNPAPLLQATVTE